MIHLGSIVQFVFLVVLVLQPSVSLLMKKTEESFENYVIDVFFSNSLNIIRCNPHERQILRGMSLNTIGRIRCSNSHSFLPSNHIEEIALLEWNSTKSKCSKKLEKLEKAKEKEITKKGKKKKEKEKKKETPAPPLEKQTIEEKTYLHVLHKPTKAFKKQVLKVIRVESTGTSEVVWKEKEKLVYFQHPPRQYEESAENISTNVYSFKHRPLLCREQYLTPLKPCATDIQPQNLSYVCYYRVGQARLWHAELRFFPLQIGVKEPPTIADMEGELERLPKSIEIDDDSSVDLYTNKTPKPKPESKKMWHLGGIILVVVIVLGGGASLYLWACPSNSHSSGRRIDSDTSIG